MSALKWKDTSSYSRGDIVRATKTVEAFAGRLRIVVTRRLHCEGWHLNCDPLYQAAQLQSVDLEDAKQEAIAIVQADLRRALAALA